MGADRAAWSKNAMSAGRGSKKYRHFDFSRVFLLPSGAIPVLRTSYQVPVRASMFYLGSTATAYVVRRTRYGFPCKDREREHTGNKDTGIGS
jgi:hypothetical protein